MKLVLFNVKPYTVVVINELIRTILGTINHNNLVIDTRPIHIINGSYAV